MLHSIRVYCYAVSNTASCSTVATGTCPTAGHDGSTSHTPRQRHNPQAPLQTQSLCYAGPGLLLLLAACKYSPAGCAPCVLMLQVLGQTPAALPPAGAVGSAAAAAGGSCQTAAPVPPSDHPAIWGPHPSEHQICTAAYQEHTSGQYTGHRECKGYRYIKCSRLGGTPGRPRGLMLTAGRP